MMVVCRVWCLANIAVVTIRVDAETLGGCQQGHCSDLKLIELGANHESVKIGIISIFPSPQLRNRISLPYKTTGKIVA
jgi:hypothetical protein